jgi:hypothetical protein
MVMISPDVISPMSDDLERAFGLEVFDKSIQAFQVGVPVDMEAIYRDFVLGNYPKAKDNAEKYIKEQGMGGMTMPAIPGLGEPADAAGAPGAPMASGLNTAGQEKSPLRAALKNNLITK